MAAIKKTIIEGCINPPPPPPVRATVNKWQRFHAFVSVWTREMHAHSLNSCTRLRPKIVFDFIWFRMDNSLCHIKTMHVARQCTAPHISGGTKGAMGAIAPLGRFSRKKILRKKTKKGPFENEAHEIRRVFKNGYRLVSETYKICILLLHVHDQA